LASEKLHRRAGGWFLLRGHGLVRLLSHPRAPLVLLAIVCTVATGARAFHLGIPAERQPPSGTIFDETYYVNAARVIAGVHIDSRERYARSSPNGTDPNAEHPQLGKLAIAGMIELAGDNSIAWRIPALALGLAALLLLYWLVRSAGGGPWLALGTTTLASFENLWLVSSRIAVLDIYCVPFMLAGVGFYLRRRPIVAGVMIALGACFKESALFALAVVLLLEALRGLSWALSGWSSRRNGGTWPRPEWRRLVRPVTVSLVTVVAFVSSLSILDGLVTPYSDGHPVTRGQAAICGHVWLLRSGCNHFAFMVHYANTLRSPKGPEGIASYPWQFWADIKQIPYYTQTVTVSSRGKPSVTKTVIAVKGVISRVLLYTSWVGILLTLWWAARKRDDLSLLTIAWILGTWLPLQILSLTEQRTTYLYYMVITMPALYIAVARLLGWVGSLRVRGRLWPTRALVTAWFVAFLVEFVMLYPFRTLSGS
jgi:hypothetical protein